jgi:hypothetical protein
MLVGLAIGLLDYRFDLVTRIGRKLVKLLRLDLPPDSLAVRQERAGGGYALCGAIAVVAALAHLPADLVVSGTADYSDWRVQLLWPLSNRGWIYPRVPWGDIGITLIFAAGVMFMVMRPRKIRWIAAASLVAVVAYIALRPIIAK